MKYFTLVIILFLILNQQFQAQTTAQDWQTDLMFLQKTVHDEYSFLFKKVSKVDFDKEVSKLYSDIPKLQHHEIIAGFSRVVSLFQYGHTDVIYDQNITKFHNLPINFYQFSDGIYLQAVTKDYKDALGSKVLKIGEMPIDDALKAIRAVIPVENDQYFKSNFPYYLRIPEILHAQRIIPSLSNKVKLTLEKNGKIFEQTFEAKSNLKAINNYDFFSNDSLWIDARKNDQTPLYLKNLDKIYYYEYLPASKTVYIRHSQIEDDPSENIAKFYDIVFDFVEKNDVEKLVLDVRLNGGGNNYKNKPIITGLIKSKINQKGKLYVILGRRTFSACQNLVNELHTYTDAIFIGEPPSENVNFYGDNNKIELPKSKLKVALSFAWWQDKPPFENDEWLAPNLAVDMSFDDYRENRDPILEAAINFADKDFIADPMAYITDLFLSGKVAMIEPEVKRFASDSRYRFYNLEDKMLRAVGHLMKRNDYASATFICELLTRCYSTSPKPWHVLTDLYAKTNEVEKAKVAMEKVVELGGGK